MKFRPVNCGKESSSQKVMNTQSPCYMACVFCPLRAGLGPYGGPPVAGRTGVKCVQLQSLRDTSKPGK